jgi:GNAT superfamily N-acetyltransferase
LPEARLIMARAFGTFMGVPEPDKLWSDRNMVDSRFHANPSMALAAESGGSLAGSNFVSIWGSFGFFGPLTVRPDLWDRHIGTAIMEATIALLDRAGTREAGLFTFAQSPKHIGLYQKFGFWPRFLTALMSKPARAGNASFVPYSALSVDDRRGALDACAALTGSILEGLDVRAEIESVHAQNLGETVLLANDTVDGFAVCHCGAGTEAGTGNCYVKFAAVRPGAEAPQRFDQLLDACEALAQIRGLERIEAGVNMGRSSAYRHLLQRGFRTAFQGVAMHKPDGNGYNRQNVYVLDDWR